MFTCVSNDIFFNIDFVCSAPYKRFSFLFSIFSHHLQKISHLTNLFRTHLYRTCTTTFSSNVVELVSSKIIKDGRINLKLADFCLQIHYRTGGKDKYQRFFFLYIWSPNIHGSSFEIIKSKLTEGYFLFDVFVLEQTTTKIYGFHIDTTFYLFILFSLIKVSRLGVKRRMRCERGRIFREGETFAWCWFHEELFVVKISIKGKDESSFHYEKKNL